jgi:hypothetical protein
VSDHWTQEEVEATVASYFVMLAAELAHQRANKAAQNRALQALIGRSRGAIEFKHQNISAVLIELGYPYIEGYKPARNYQALLRDVVAERLDADANLRVAAASAVGEPVSREPALLNWDAVHVRAPKQERRSGMLYERRATSVPVVRSVNYLEREARNQLLGAAGEDYVLRLEHERLRKAGAHRLADRVEHASRTKGDGLGYDILSFEKNGRERLIEVKTTRFGELTPFFASANEVAVSDEMSDRYHLYRLFRFEKGARLFVLSGSLRSSVDLEPALYRASIP